MRHHAAGVYRHGAVLTVELVFDEFRKRVDLGLLRTRHLFRRHLARADFAQDFFPRLAMIYQRRRVQVRTQVEIAAGHPLVVAERTGSGDHRLYYAIKFWNAWEIRTGSRR